MKSIVLILLIVASIAGVFLLNDKNGDSQASITSILTKTTPAPTPFLFQEMTIPYLRSKEFKSELRGLQRVSENGSFTSYLTSYESESFKINGLLTIPKNNLAKHPAIIFIHGYIPPASYNTLERYTDHVNYLARNGFVVFKIDLRGHGNSEGDAGGGYYAADYVIDTLNAYAALQNTDFVESDKIGMWGHSMAGNIVMRAIAANPEIPAAVVWAGAGYTYSDLQQYRIDDNSYRPPPTDSPQSRKRQLLRETYGNFDPNHQFWKQVTPVNYLEGIKTAIEVHHAINDEVVSIEYGRNLMRVLDTTPIEHTLHEYSSGGHNITGSSFTQAMQRSVEFFKKKL